MLYDLNSTPPGLPTQTVATAARATGMSEVTIRRRIKDGTLPAYRVGTAIRINSADLFHLYEPVNMQPSESQERIEKMKKARTRQKSYKALRVVQIAEDDSTPGGEYPNNAVTHSDPTAGAAVYIVDKPAVRVGSTGQHVIFDKLKREAGPFGVTDGVRELTYHNGRESEAWKREHHKAVNLD